MILAEKIAELALTEQQSLIHSSCSLVSSFLDFFYVMF